MSGCSLHIYPGYEQPALRLAERLGCGTAIIHVHAFPDGESRVQVEPATKTVCVYASLDQPNPKLIELIFAAEALRSLGATRLVLVCPYLCYMRQDKAFHKGEAVSQQVIGALLSRYFDRIVTVDPHLHRISSLDEVFQGAETTTLSATGLIADMIAQDPAFSDALLVGPDSESFQWVQVVAQQTGLDFIVAEKVRQGDRNISIKMPDAGVANGRTAIIIDDVISSGTTICRCAHLLHEAGAARIETVTVHALCSADDLERIRATGVSRVRSCDGVLHETNAISLAAILASTLQKEM